MHLALLAEDDPAVQKVVQLLLESDGFRVVIAASGSRAERDARSKRPDIVLIDLGLPDLDGLELIRIVRQWSPVPILVLSARTAESQRLAAFEAGADDYVIKPFSAAELLARVRALLRRHARGQTPAAVLQLGELSIDLTRRVARRVRGEELRLTPLEHRILETLNRSRGRVVTQSQLMREVWGPHRVDTRSLRVFITTLRKKLEVDPARPLHILTEPGIGYRLATDIDSQSQSAAS
jgi:two-component system KDP operon response regulator KdpE